MEKSVGQGLDWAGLPVIATVARLLSSSATEPRTLTPSRGGSRDLRRQCVGSRFERIQMRPRGRN